MAAIGKIRPEQIERARKLLQDLPEKDARKTREEAAGFLEKDFRKALQRGYTPKELSMMLKNAGIIIPAYLVEKFLEPKNEAVSPKPAPKPAQRSAPKPAPVASAPAGATPAKSAGPCPEGWTLAPKSQNKKTGAFTCNAKPGTALPAVKTTCPGDLTYFENAKKGHLGCKP